MRDFFKGHLDTCDNLNLRGWAWDSRSNDPTDVDILFDGKLLFRIKPNMFRIDLAQAGIGTGYHAFEQKLPPELLAKPHGLISIREVAARPLAIWSGNQTLAALYQLDKRNQREEKNTLNQILAYFYLTYVRGKVTSDNFHLLPWFYLHLTEFMEKLEVAQFLGRFLIFNFENKPGPLLQPVISQITPYLDEENRNLVFRLIPDQAVGLKSLFEEAAHLQTPPDPSSNKWKIKGPQYFRQAFLKI